MVVAMTVQALISFLRCQGQKSSHAVVITAAGDSSTQRGGGIGKSLAWENVVSPSNQVTVIVSTTNKRVHISFYGTTIGFARTLCVRPNSLCAEIVLFVRFYP